MTDVPLDESDIKSCQEFVTQALEKDKFYLLLRFMERKKTKTIGTDEYQLTYRQYLLRYM